MEIETQHPEAISPGRLAALERKAGAPVHHARDLDAMAKQGAPPTGPAFVSLDCETRAALDTASAAHHLNRRPQTLRAWACLENGPLRPVRVFGRLAWPTAEIRRLLGVA